MHFKIEKEQLITSLQIAAKAISSRSTLPILGGLLLSIKKDELTAYATDLEVAIKQTTKLTADEESETVIPARLLLEVIKNMPEGTISVVLNKKDNRLELSSENTRFNINTLPAEDYPKFPDVEKPLKLTLKTKEFTKAINSISSSASKDESRPILTGILFSVNEQGAELIATDSYRLATSKVTMPNAKEIGREIIIPAKTLETVAGTIKEKEDLEILLSENQIIFMFDNTTIASKLIGGQFPDYKQLFPEKLDVIITANKEDILEAIKRVALMAHNNSPIKLSMANGKIKITTQAADVGDAREEVEGTKKGPDIEIAFNARYLLEGIAGADGEKIKMMLSDPLQPGLIKNEEGEKYKYLIMPIRLS